MKNIISQRKRKFSAKSFKFKILVLRGGFRNILVQKNTFTCGTKSEF